MADLRRTRGVQFLQQNDPLRALLCSVRALEQLDGLPSAAPESGELTLDRSLRFRIAALLECLPPVVARRTIDAYDWRRIRLDPASLFLDANAPQLQFLPGGELAVVSTVNDVAFRWNPQTDSLRRMALSGAPATDGPAAPEDTGASAPSPTYFAKNTQFAVRSSADGNLEFWSCEPERLICHLEAAEGDLGSLVGGWISPDGRWVVAGFASDALVPSLVVWNVRTGRRMPTPAVQVTPPPPPFHLNVRFLGRRSPSHCGNR